MVDSDEGENDEPYLIRDFTEAFVVRKTIRRLGRVHIPLREGLLVSDLKVFGAALIVWMFIYGLVVNSLLSAALRLVGAGPLTGIPYLLVVLTPPLAATMASRTPVRHRQTIAGMVRTWIRDLVDDPIHRRGVPVRADRSPSTYTLAVWTADPNRLPHLAPTEPLPWTVQRRHPGARRDARRK